MVRPTVAAWSSRPQKALLTVPSESHALRAGHTVRSVRRPRGTAAITRAARRRRSGRQSPDHPRRSLISPIRRSAPSRRADAQILTPEVAPETRESAQRRTPAPAERHPQLAQPDCQRAACRASSPTLVVRPLRQRRDGERRSAQPPHACSRSHWTAALAAVDADGP